jgi:hypothetical protein
MVSFIAVFYRAGATICKYKQIRIRWIYESLKLCRITYCVQHVLLHKENWNLWDNLEFHCCNPSFSIAKWFNTEFCNIYTWIGQLIDFLSSLQYNNHCCHVFVQKHLTSCTSTQLPARTRHPLHYTAVPTWPQNTHDHVLTLTDWLKADHQQLSTRNFISVTWQPIGIFCSIISCNFNIFIFN